MKEILLQYAAYNLWAHQRLLVAIGGLTKEQQHQNIIGSFSSVQATLQHMANAEHIWWQRIKLIEATLPAADPNQSVEDISATLLISSRQWKEWVEKSSANALEHVFSYHNSKREEFKQPVYQMLLHMFNHATYHRGQLVTMLRQMNVDKIPATDFIVWSRSKK